MVLPSPYKPFPCRSCSKTIETLSPICEGCHTLQSLPVSGVNHFAILGVKESLAIDETKLRERFYALSKVIHPDRYTNSPPPEPIYAAQWSSEINKAYQTLRDAKKRSHYLLELYAVKPTDKSKMPMELAESYFELQDLLLEDDGAAHMAEFKKGLIKQIEESTTTWNAIAVDWEKGAEKEGLLSRLSDLLNRQRYLHSMLSDLDRKMGDTSGNRWN